MQRSLLPLHKDIHMVAMHAEGLPLVQSAASPQGSYQEACPMRACSPPACAMSLQGRYQEAARMFAKHGQVERAMEMFTDLRQFAEAKAWAEAWARSNSGAAAPRDAAQHKRHLA